MKIETCGWYKRRDGEKARVICVDADGTYPVIALHGVDIREHYDNGGWAPDRKQTSAFDLVAQWTDDPTPGSLEWANALPLETRLWRAGMPANSWVCSALLVDTSARDGWHIVGSASWANALPEGTRIQHNAWTSEANPLKNSFTVRKGTHWSKPCDYAWTPSEGPIEGWLLHTDHKLRAWLPEEVPVGAVLDGDDWSAIISFCEMGSHDQWIVGACDSSGEAKGRVGIRRWTLDEIASTTNKWRWPNELKSVGRRCGVEETP